MDDIETKSTLVVRHLNKHFGSIQALIDVSFAAFCGQVLGLIGPNGAGKTTLLECLCGLLPTNGEVLWHGKNLPSQRRRTVMFYLPDGIVPTPEHSVRQTLRFFGEVYESNRIESARLLETLGLLPVLDRPMGRLSKGWRRRVLLGIGLLAPHPLLLIDEPFDGLDLRQTREMMAIFKEESSKGRTLVLSIHQLIEAERVCDRFVLLSAGRKAGEGTLTELCAQAKVQGAGLEDVFLALS